MNTTLTRRTVSYEHIEVEHTLAYVCDVCSTVVNTPHIVTTARTFAALEYERQANIKARDIRVPWELEDLAYEVHVKLGVRPESDLYQLVLALGVRYAERLGQFDDRWRAFDRQKKTCRARPRTSKQIDRRIHDLMTKWQVTCESKAIRWLIVASAMEVGVI